MAADGAQLVMAAFEVVVVRHMGTITELDGLPIGQPHLLSQPTEQSPLFQNQFHRLVEI